MTGTGARDQVSRLLTLVPYLHTRDEVRLDQAASLLGVEERQLVKDLKVLFMCGRPGGLPDDLIDVDVDALDEGVIRVSNAEYLARPLRLSQVEASAMIVALRALRPGAEPQTREIVDRTLAKLETAAAEAGAAARVVVGEEPSDAQLERLAGELDRAVTAGRQVRLSYYVPSRDEQSERVVDPHRLVTENGHRYLDAWCHSAEAPRWFRLDRVEEAVVLDSAVATEPEQRSLSPSMFEQAGETDRATLRLAPEAAWVPEYYPVLAQRTLADSSIEVDLVVTDPRWLTGLLLRIAPHGRVIDPPEFTEAFTATSREALSLYR